MQGKHQQENVDHITDLKDQLLDPYATSDGVPKRDDDAETTELFKQVLHEHAKMKSVLLNELLDSNV